VTVTDVRKDTTALTMTINCEWDAPIERVWQLWADPRQLERWWGPPTYPATVVDHDLTPGGRVNYYMTGPDGDQPRGWWRVIAVDPPHRADDHRHDRGCDDRLIAVLPRVRRHELRIVEALGDAVGI